jgi:hypothetical protein
MSKKTQLVSSSIIAGLVVSCLVAAKPAPSSIHKALSSPIRRAAVPAPAPVNVSLAADTWTVSRQSISWISQGKTDAGVPQSDIAIYACYTDGDGASRQCETIIVRSDGSAIVNSRGQSIGVPAPALVTTLTNLGSHLDTMLTNLANGGKLKPR